MKGFFAFGISNCVICNKEFVKRVPGQKSCASYKCSDEMYKANAKRRKIRVDSEKKRSSKRIKPK